MSFDISLYQVCQPADFRFADGAIIIREIAYPLKQRLKKGEEEGERTLRRIQGAGGGQVIAEAERLFQILSDPLAEGVTFAVITEALRRVVGDDNNGWTARAKATYTGSKSAAYLLTLSLLGIAERWAAAMLARVNDAETLLMARLMGDTPRTGFVAVKLSSEPTPIAAPPAAESAVVETSATTSAAPEKTGGPKGPPKKK